MHFKLIVLKCVLAVPVHNNIIIKKSIHFFVLFFVWIFLNVFTCLKLSRLILWRHYIGRPSQDCWLTAAFQHRPALSELSSVHMLCSILCVLLPYELVLKTLLELYLHHCVYWSNIVWCWVDEQLSLPLSLPPLTLKQAGVENDYQKIISCHFLYHLDSGEHIQRNFWNIWSSFISHNMLPYLL